MRSAVDVVQDKAEARAKSDVLSLSTVRTSGKVLEIFVITGLSFSALFFFYLTPRTLATAWFEVYPVYWLGQLSGSQLTSATLSPLLPGAMFFISLV